MARLHLEFPEDQFYFTTQLTVRITDINSGKHLANDSMVSMISEARARFLYQFGIEEAGVSDVGIIVTDLATTYLKEAFARETLVFEVGLMDLNKYGGDIIFRITKADNGDLVALAKSGFVFYHFHSAKVAPMPEDFRLRFPGVNQAQE
ncbi:thioesterase-like protein [Pseudomonas saudimassiliensis]|uniref:Thioesterase-like protein n=1 Tax=Pseudomonas saudimassiliensis TaxID=1461581 RepID=A0A078MCV8_9PSED|nr:thioesterase family protein [Pseudomonas saudimassiliensis]CEA05218.1 thioesterase-like protein [Pseudomonas saudimassiliensis]CEF27025.1 thioesterase-like protein [Pseudomonas saudimassiliensis]